jgi:2-polyprenyl-3-methyl-5-hydroxy-6-metoxy-1,4-benzoquinol methylase
MTNLYNNSGEKMKLPKINSTDRIDFIMDRIKGKKVLHLGCADWPFTENKLAKGSLLHQKMQRVAGELVGVDLSSPGVQLMINAGISDVILGNSEKDLYELLNQKFDVVVAGEVIEHVLNPGLFLDSIKTVLNENSILIITTPNFAPIKRIPRLLWRNEEVHPDHVYYFSFSTLSKLFDQSGYKPIEWAVHWWDVGWLSIALNKIFRKIPFLQYYGDGFCVVCSPK